MLIKKSISFIANALLNLFFAGAKGEDITNPNRVKSANIVIPQSTLDLGIMCIGASGSGKTVSAGLGLAKYLSSNYQGCCFFDGKGDLNLYHQSKASSINFDYFFSSELEQSDSINLMEGNAQDVIARLTNILIGHSSNTSFYADLQTNTLNNYIYLLKATNKASNLKDLYVAMRYQAATSYLLHEVGDNIDPLIASEIRAASDNKDRLDNLQGLLNKLREFTYGKMNERLNDYSPSISLSECIAYNKSIYFHMPYTHRSKAIAIAIIEALGIEAKNRQLSTKDFNSYHLIMDDWGSFFHDNFGSISSRCRSAKMPLSFMFQSYGQLEALGRSFTIEMSDNLATKICFRINSTETANFTSSFFGSFSGIDTSTTEGDLARRSYTYNEQEKLNVDEFYELPKGRAYMKTLDNCALKTFKVQFPLPFSDEDLENEQTTEFKNKLCDLESGLNLSGLFVNENKSTTNTNKTKPNKAASVSAKKNAAVNEDADSGIEVY